MIFEVTSDQVERLDESQVVDLLRRLISAELNKNSIPLRSGTAPAQITIPDGGDDARVSWSGGPNESDWLPSRFTVFQSKKGTTSPAQLKAETQTKSTQGTNAPKLSEALEEAISQSGAYVIVTPTPVVGTNVDRRIKAIREGINDTGNDPFLLSSIQIYDCNRLAAWTNTHPSVALWVNALLRNVHLGGFQTFEDWGRAPEISEIAFQQNDDTRFVAKGSEIQTWQNEDASISQAKSFDEIREVISTFLGTRGNAVRVIGPSGFGKTRLVHQLIAGRATLAQDVLSESQVIYCLYEDVRDRLLNIAREIADTGSRALMIIDDCPDSVHTRLSETVHRDGSRCHLVTIGVETKAYGVRRNLIVELNAASNELIGHIAEATNKQVSEKNASLIRNLSQGFPRMAVFASKALEGGDEELSSVETLISRIVWGEHEFDQSALESLQLLSLFTIVGMENDAAKELEEIADYCGKTARQMFNELRRFAERGVLFRQGDYGEVQPLPLAMRLSNQWLESNPAGTLEDLFRSLSEEMKLRMVGRLRWVSWSGKVSDFGRALLSEALPNEAALDSEFGSKLLDRFVHLAPDATMDHLDRLLSGKSIDEFAAFDTGRRYAIWALEKLVFRRQTFDAAARLLLKLGAAENEDWANNASGQFAGLYQLYLSGTEATPEEKLVVLDDGLADADERVRKLCIDALNRMLENWHFSRSGGSEHIGAGEALQDWQPETYGEVFDYYRAALSRLERIALDTNDPSHHRALDTIGSHLRGLFSNVNLLDEIQAMIDRLRKAYPAWHKAALGVNAWLYFDRHGADESYQRRLREYYDELLPDDPLEQIHFYCSGWATDIHDPDVSYDREGDNDHYYGKNKIHELIDAAPNEASYFFSFLDTLLERVTNSGWIAVVRIARHVADPEHLLRHLVQNITADSEIAVISNLARNVISGAAQIDRNKGLECLEIALDVQSLSGASVEFLASVGLDDALMRRAIEFVQNDTVEPHQVSVIAFSDILQTVDYGLIELLVSTLLTKQAYGAWAAVDFLVQVLYRSDPDKGRLLQSLKAVVTNRALFDKPRYSNMDWYHWCELVEKIFNGGHVDDAFSGELVDFIISVTSVEEYNVQLSLDDYAQKILRRIITSSPRLVWEKYHDARASLDGRALYRLPSLFEAGVGEPSAPGVFNDIPAEIYVPWMLENKEERMPFILDWIQLFDGTENARNWNSAFVSFVDAHVDRVERLNALRSRLTTGMWWGSYASKLEVERDLLLQLRELSRNPNVHRWIDRTTLQMEQNITDERRRDANREASYRA
ncbi:MULTISPECIES: hypothetical protein [unclassified Mesorhizobium]|uniref:hypothetical protein n=1 Tax=unclassified Mesorhizobium TaxID=325217 RepID=UPI0011270BFE|nr:MULTISPECIES: hypothetical protein [unclassified Mesorhizobium]MCA0028172.1 hypothetical protein [Mesorhizobium sp. B263B1A]TPJ92087.1 hypothetical protein FJ489_24085 [Mesorhizobium sp. B2-5-12]TPK24110.1 hypothetical protein FJ562_18110 [Mesorhizobium sp. B2-5-6]